MVQEAAQTGQTYIHEGCGGEGADGGGGQERRTAATSAFAVYVTTLPAESCARIRTRQHQQGGHSQQTVNVYWWE